MRPDPPVRRDGRCAQCGGPRDTEASAKYAGDQAERDPFCAARCARNWHGCPIPGDDGSMGAQEAAGARVQAERRAKAGV